MYVCMYLSVYLSMYLSMYVYLYVCMYTFPLFNFNSNLCADDISAGNSTQITNWKKA